LTVFFLYGQLDFPFLAFLRPTSTFTSASMGLMFFGLAILGVGLGQRIDRFLGIFFVMLQPDHDIEQRTELRQIVGIKFGPSLSQCRLRPPIWRSANAGWLRLLIRMIRSFSGEAELERHGPVRRHTALVKRPQGGGNAAFEYWIGSRNYAWEKRRKQVHSRDEEAGLLYYQGVDAIKTGGHELYMLANHLILMIQGTSTFVGPLWPSRILQPDRKKIKLDRFIDYLCKPIREGLGLPSLHFLRQVLKASKSDGELALQLVRQELAKEHVNFDAVADQERDTELLKRQPGPHGGARTKASGTVPLDKGGYTRLAARLAQRRPDLAEQVRVGKLKLSTALNQAGIRKRFTTFEQIMKLLPKLTPEELQDLIKAAQNALPNP
jgi:hypothetical protein